MLTRILRRGAVDARITCLSHSSRRRLLWAVALPVSPLRISLAPGQCRVASPVKVVWGWSSWQRHSSSTRSAEVWVIAPPTP